VRTHRLCCSNPAKSERGIPSRGGSR
jgi:hypothetical protein